MKKIDLFLNSRTGLRSLEIIHPVEVSTVFALDKEIVSSAKKLGFNVRTDWKSNSSDIGFSIHWPKIFSKHEIKKYSLLLNIHPGLIPQSRGTFPIFWNILNDTQPGITVHKIVEELDAGPILERIQIPKIKNENAGQLNERIIQAELQIIPRIIKRLPYLNEKDFFEFDEPLGKNYKLSDFELLKNNKDFALSNYEPALLKRAFTHDKFSIPDFLK